MSAGRVVSTLVSCAAVCGCAAVVVGLTHANTPKPTSRADERGAAAAAYRPRTVTEPSAAVSTATPSTSPSATPTAASTSLPAGTASALPTSATSTSAPPTSRAAVTVAPAVPRASAAPVATRTTAAPHPAQRPAVTHAAPVRRPVQKPVQKAAAPAGQKLPLRYTTGSATRVITVTAGSSRSTTATLQPWTKLSNGRWKKYGSSVRAYVGSDGIGSASETRSKTPAGSFTLTQAFGRNSDPGTSLPYFRTNPNDYWVSSPGKYYNTHRRCGSCGYNNGVNERLYYVNPEYRYAALIDYNTRNAPGGVKQGKGSAFFLHVQDGSPTAGCVAIPERNLISVLRWLTPGTHPRILIGVT